MKKDAEQQKINVHFYIANLNGGYYTVDGEQVTSHDVQANDRVAFPELTVNDGYELKGWQVDGKYSAVWEADSKEAIGIEGLASDSGDLAITPILVKRIPRLTRMARSTSISTLQTGSPATIS